MRRKEIDEKKEEMRDMELRIIRVMKREGEEVGKWEGKIKEEEMKEGISKMMMLSEYDERMMMEKSKGKK